jgi:hypothetical protein
MESIFDWGTVVVYALALIAVFLIREYSHDALFRELYGKRAKKMHDQWHKDGFI